LTAEFNPEVVFGDDDRKRITNTRDFPWRCICWLRIAVPPDGRLHYLGTGWLVGPRTVITAGHCVFLKKFRAWALHVEVYPGRNAGDTPFGGYVSRDLRSVADWTERLDPSRDYGAVILPEPLTLGFFGHEAMDAGALKALPYVHVCGYPGEELGKPDGTLWGTARRLQAVRADTLVYNLSTHEGQSGAPVFYTNGDQRVVVGIHTSGNDFGNYATRITDDVYDMITRWKNLGT
jgi:V8-like Glu-specific endopeptidase